jgi:hypothetical protein
VKRKLIYVDLEVMYLFFLFTVTGSGVEVLHESYSKRIVSKCSSLSTEALPFLTKTFAQTVIFVGPKVSD